MNEIEALENLYVNCHGMRLSQIEKELMKIIKFLKGGKDE